MHEKHERTRKGIALDCGGAHDRLWRSAASGQRWRVRCSRAGPLCAGGHARCRNARAGITPGRCSIRGQGSWQQHGSVGWTRVSGRRSYIAAQGPAPETFCSCRPAASWGHTGTGFWFRISAARRHRAAGSLCNRARPMALALHHLHAVSPAPAKLIANQALTATSWSRALEG